MGDYVRFWSFLKVFNKKKGFGTSTAKAMKVAMAEERFTMNVSNRRLLAFLTYMLFKGFCRHYRLLVRDIYFKTGFTKFLLYTLTIFIPTEVREIFTELEEDMLVFEEHGRI